MSLPVLSQASPTTTSLPAVVGAARVQVCELVPEEDWVQTVCEALTQEMAACAGIEPRDKTAKRKKLFKVTSTKRFQVDNLAITISLQMPDSATECRFRAGQGQLKATQSATTTER